SVESSALRRSPLGGRSGEAEGAGREEVPDQRSTGGQSQDAQARQPHPCEVLGTREGPQGRQRLASVQQVRGRAIGAGALSLTPQLAQKKDDCQQVDAERLRSSLQTYYRMLDVACELRAEETAAGADLSTRMAW